MLGRLGELLGRERDLNDVARVLRDHVRALRPDVVGAHQVTCSDEAERECVEAFQRNFVRFQLPSLKFFEKAAFRTANLGGRYEWGSIRVAEDHYERARTRGWKLLLVKVNAHVSVETGADGVPVYGVKSRYGTESVYCGPLHAMLADHPSPFADDLEDAFRSEGQDRLAVLRDPERVEPTYRSLVAAAISARLQARKAMVDLQDHTPAGPTLYLVVASVSINREGHDTELVVGVYQSDRRTNEVRDEYVGIGDDPAAITVVQGLQRVELVHPDRDRVRSARDHRALVLEEWRKRGRRPHEGSPAVQRAIQEAVAETHSAKVLPRAALQTLLGVLLHAAPVPAAAILFGEGLVHAFHLHQAHRLAREADADPAARAMLSDLKQSVDRLSDEEARHLVELLRREYA